MSEHITALNLVRNKVQPKFSSLLRRASKILKFAQRYKFELSDKQSQILVANSCERVKVLKFAKTALLNL